MNNGTLTFRLTGRGICEFFFWLVFFMPLAIIRMIPYGDILAILLCMPFVCIIFGNYIRMSNRLFDLSIYWFWVIVLIAWSFFAICINTPSQIIECTKKLYVIAEMLLVISYSVNCDGVEGIKPLYYVSNIYIVLNFLSMILCPNGLYVSSIGSSVARAQWLFGSKNNIPVYMNIFSFVILIYVMNQDVKKSKKRMLWMNIVVLMACFASTSANEVKVGFLQGSSTGIIMSMALVALLIYINVPEWLIKRKLDFITVNIILILAILANFLVIKGTEIPILSDFIINQLHKNMTFSGRLYVWQNAIPYILKKPFFGHGYTFKIFWKNGATSTYNMFLGVMKSYGVPAVVFFALALTSVKNSKKLSIQIALVGLFMVIINGLMSEVDIMFALFFTSYIEAVEHWYGNKEIEESQDLNNGKRKKKVKGFVHNI